MGADFVFILVSIGVKNATKTPVFGLHQPKIRTRLFPYLNSLSQ